MIKVVLFDLDDTLYPEIDYVKSGFSEVAKVIASKINLTDTEIYELTMALFNDSKNNVFNRLVEQLNLDNSILPTLIKTYQFHSPNIKFYDDVMPCLNDLKQNGIRTGIITDGRVEGQEAKLKALNCYGLFEKIIITDSLGGIEYRKPNPKAFELMKNHFNCEFDEMMYIGDNPEKDFYIEKTHKVKTIQIQRKDNLYTSKLYLNDYEPNKKISTLQDLLK